MLPRSYFHIPLSADTHLMDPVLFPLPVFRTPCRWLPPPVFLSPSFYSVSLFAILWFSQKNREDSCRDGKSSASDREAHGLWSSTADEAHQTSWLTDLCKSCREANVARLVCSTTAYTQTDSQRAELPAQSSPQQSSESATYPPPTRLHLFCSCSAFTPSSPHSQLPHST